VLGMGVEARDYNFGELFPAKVSGFAYVDANNNGVKDAGEQPIAGVTVALGGAANLTTTTNGSGFYQFSNLLPGTYTLLEAHPTNFLDGTDVIGTQGGTMANDAMSAITLNSGTVGINNNFGELVPASLSGFVYADVNNNGVKEGGETPIPGVLITLTVFSDLGPSTQTRTTDGTGFYQFTDLRPGTYSLAEAQPTSHLDGKDTIGSQGGTPGNDQFSNIVLAQGTNGVNNNFGEIPPAGLSGFVYVDNDDDGVKDLGDEGIPGATVTLSGTDDLGAVNIPTTTDATGFYRFPNLRPGAYTITETQPDSFKDGKDTIGTPGGNSGNDVFSNIVLPAGVLGANNNFGEIRHTH
jgi:hypothetical protein